MHALGIVLASNHTIKILKMENAKIEISQKEITPSLVEFSNGLKKNSSLQVLDMGIIPESC